MITALFLAAAALTSTAPPDTPVEPFTEATLEVFLDGDAADSLCEYYYGELFAAHVVADQYELNAGDAETVVDRVRFEVLYEAVEVEGLRLTDEARERLFEWFDECEASMAGQMPAVEAPATTG